MYTRAEILAVYQAGPEAVVALIEALQVSQAQQLQALTARVSELEARLAKNSHNSSQPPSSDGPARRPQSLRRASGKKPGGQQGHPGTTLAVSATPDTRLAHRPATCAACGSQLTAVAVDAATAPVRRQVYELPPQRLQVTEHVALTKCCPHCQHRTPGTFPDGVTQATQYGPQVRAWAVYLSQYQLLPVERIGQLLQDSFGHRPSSGTLLNWIAACACRLEPVEAAIKDHLQQVPVLNTDETGVRIEGHTHWLHSASTPQVTCYAVHPQRGQAAMAAMGILPHFQGRAVHDAWSSYYQFECDHALCNAHLLRELRFVQDHLHQPWAAALAQFLCRLKTAVTAVQAQGLTQLSASRWRRFERRYQELLAAGWQANPAPPRSGQRGRTKQGPARNLLARLDQRRHEVLAFARDFRVPFDNNLAERDLRMTKVQQKISGCFRSLAGAQHFCRIRGYLSTMRKQGQDVLSALQSVFAGDPRYPAFST
jgi:transposase